VHVHVAERSPQESSEQARARFRDGWLRCENALGLVLIAKTYQDDGDLPHALAYVEQFLAVIGETHELRAAMERAAAELRQRVPEAQRINIAGELAPAPALPVAAPAAGTSTPASPDMRGRLNRQVDAFDWASKPGPRGIERARGVFVGASLAYAAKAQVEVGTERMTGTVEFPAAFAGELQAGYRFHRFLSVALAPQMFFHLKPNQQDAARELDVFVQTTGHLVLAPRWDVEVFAAPGYSVLMVPGAEDARGLAFRWGGGPMFHLTERIGFTVEFSHQLGFQTTERTGADVDMATSFVSLFTGIRVHR
jgi:hypothetical protein